MSSRTRPVRVKGGWEENVFSPIPVRILSDLDFFYGPTETKKLSDIWSRHKLAWLWTVIHEATERDGGLVYHAALAMIDEHGDWLDGQKDEKDKKGWSAILRGHRWQRGIILPGEEKGAGQMTVARWTMPGEKKRKIPVRGEGSVDERYLDFVLTAYDLLSCGGESPPPTLRAVEDEAIRQDMRAADALCFSAEQAGLEPAR